MPENLEYRLEPILHSMSKWGSGWRAKWPVESARSRTGAIFDNGQRRRVCNECQFAHGLQWKLDAETVTGDASAHVALLRGAIARLAFVTGVLMVLQDHRGACRVRCLVQNRYRATQAGLQQQGDDCEQHQRYGNPRHSRQPSSHYRQ